MASSQWWCLHNYSPSLFPVEDKLTEDIEQHKWKWQTSVTGRRPKQSRLLQFPWLAQGCHLTGKAPLEGILLSSTSNTLWFYFCLCGFLVSACFASYGVLCGYCFWVVGFFCDSFTGVQNGLHIFNKWFGTIPSLSSLQNFSAHVEGIHKDILLTFYPALAG